MAREDWNRGEWVRDRRLDDYGQADYSTAYSYDPDRRSGHRVADDYAYDPETGMGYRREAHEARTFSRDDRDRRRGPSDRVLWAVIVERLEDERGLDLRDVEVSVRDREVFLDGEVKRKGDKRRIEDIADIDGVENVQNNLRVRRRSFGLF